MLVVEDDRSLAEQLSKGLTRAGCVVATVGTGAAALQQLNVDMVLLDLGLPDLDGTEVCLRIRSTTAVPVIVLTARDSERDRVRALDFGADDYLCKPFGFAELIARMRAVLRRTGRRPAVIHHGSLAVDLGSRQVTLDGAPIQLTGKEFDILACLLSEAGRVVTRDEIFERVWDRHWYGPTRVLDVHLASLRRKLGVPALIETVHGRGLRVAAT